jgi:hypothetical protein
VTDCATARARPVRLPAGTHASETIERMASNPRFIRHERAVLVAPLLVVALGASGCAVVSVAGTAVGVAGSAAGAALSVGGAVVGSTARVAGKVVEKTIDVVVPGDSSK